MKRTEDAPRVLTALERKVLKALPTSHRGIKRHEFVPKVGIQTAIHKEPLGTDGQLVIMAGQVDPRTESYVASLLTASSRLLQKADTSEGTLAIALRERATALEDQARRHVPTAVSLAKGVQTNIHAVSGEIQGSTAVGMQALGTSGVVKEGKNIHRVDGRATFSTLQNESSRLDTLDLMASAEKLRDRSYDTVTVTPSKTLGGRIVGAIVSKLTGVPSGTVRIERPMEKGSRGTYIHRSAEKVRAIQNSVLPHTSFADPDVSDRMTSAEIDRAHVIAAREDAVNYQWVQDHTDHYGTEKGAVAIDTSPQAQAFMEHQEQLWEENYGPRPDIEHTETRGPLSWLFG